MNSLGAAAARNRVRIRTRRVLKIRHRAAGIDQAASPVNPSRSVNRGARRDAGIPGNRRGVSDDNRIRAGIDRNGGRGNRHGDLRHGCRRARAAIEREGVISGQRLADHHRAGYPWRDSRPAITRDTACSGARHCVCRPGELVLLICHPGGRRRRQRNCRICRCPVDRCRGLKCSALKRVDVLPRAGGADATAVDSRCRLPGSARSSCDRACDRLG